MSEDALANVVNLADVPEQHYAHGASWACFDRKLTPAMADPGRLGVTMARVPPGKSACPLHTHQLEDEVFYVLSGRGLFRYGDGIREIGPGDCISCPAATGIGHQIANPFDADLVYLAIGRHDPNEVCTYPDSGKIMVRALGVKGVLRDAEYFEGEPDPTALLRIG